jgi:hypothetical protein
MFSGRQLVRELQRVRQDVDAVAERLDKYEENVERLDQCVERLEGVLSRWEGTGVESRPSAPPIGDLLSAINSLSGRGTEGSLGPLISRLLDAVGPMAALAQTLQNSKRGSLRPDFSKVSREGVASVLLLGLMVSVMEDRLREGVESIIEVARPYKGLAEALLKVSGTASLFSQTSDASASSDSVKSQTSSVGTQSQASGDIIRLTM